MRSHSFAWAPALFLLALPLAAHADTLQTFTLQGTYADFARSGTFSGLVTLDTTLGTFVSASYSVSGFNSSSPITPTDPDLSHSLVSTELDLTYIHNDPSAYISVNLVIPETTLVGYTGGALCSSESNPCVGNNSGVVFFEHGSDITSGSLTLASATPVAATPEPSSLVLLGSGALAFAGSLRRRLL